MTESPTTHNYCVVLSYDGTQYFGWQRLRDQPTLQGTVERALEACAGVPVPIRGAGRTDRGAHAEGQVASFALAESRSITELTDDLNRALPADVRALSIHHVPPEFHARTSAVEKTYEYRIAIRGSGAGVALAPTRAWHLDRSLDVDSMNAAAQDLVGRRDFASLGTQPRFKQRSTVRQIRLAGVERRDGLIAITIRADSFLNHMVRNIVSALVRVGDGRSDVGRIAQILDARQRSASPGSAPACGLYLMNVRYEPPL
jgi:tRNA pseudouridine38-40 synthase